MRQTSIILMQDERGMLVWHPGPSHAHRNGTHAAESSPSAAHLEPMAPNAPYHWQADGAWDDVAA